jgi:hypothetical protein
MANHIRHLLDPNAGEGGGGFPEPVGVLASLDAVAILPDSETISVVGEEPHDPEDRERAIEDIPPTVAITNLRT